MDDDLLESFLEGNNFESARETIMKPPFGWAGSKARSLEHLLPHLPYEKTFVDVFGGSGCVTLSRHPSKLDVYNDAYSGVTDFYRCIKSAELLPLLIDYLKHNIHGREMFQLSKNEWKNTVDPVERAAKWYYMVYMSFGCLGRNFARATKSTISFGAKLQRNLELFWPIHERMKTVQVENLDFEQCMKDFDSHETVFYCDPPYMHSDIGIYDEAWPLDKHKRLLSVIFNTHGFVALSGYDNELYNAMPWDNKITWQTRITIGSKAFTETNNLIGKENVMQKEATECLWIKEIA